jgi:hypothetical protein
MTASRVFRIVRSTTDRIAPILSIAVAMLVALRSPPARAENVDELIQQLRSDSDKVRLSAAINLTKLGSARAIRPLARVLVSDSDRSVRGAAAIGLGKLVTDKTSAKDKADAVDALSQAKSDDSDLVRTQAEKSLAAIGVSAAPPGGAIYVNIGPMSSKTGDSSSDAKLQALMVKIAGRAMAKSARGMATSWPGGPPSKAVLDAKGAVGFYIDGTLNELKVKETGSSATVSCRINMLLASYPDRSIFALLNGGATVQATGSTSEIALAREDCVSAVVEDLIAKKIVPTINTKVTP